MMYRDSLNALGSTKHAYELVTISLWIIAILLGYLYHSCKQYFYSHGHNLQTVLNTILMYSVDITLCNVVTWPMNSPSKRHNLWIYNHYLLRYITFWKHQIIVEICDWHEAISISYMVKDYLDVVFHHQIPRFFTYFYVIYAIWKRKFCMGSTGMNGFPIFW